MALLRQVRDYFSFSSRDIRIIFVLITLLMVLLTIRFFSDRFYTPEPYDLTEFEKNVLILEKARRQQQEKTFRKADPVRKNPSGLTPFLFDPNLLTRQEWLRLGLSDRQVQAIMNYREKGGKFRTKEDVKRLYTISDDEYRILEPYINIAPAASPVAQSDREPVLQFRQREEIHFGSINTADSALLVRIKGIGPVFARRITNYRERLGGFHDPKQLLEVHGLDSLRCEAILAAFSFDGQFLRSLPVNKATVEQLSKHPYFDFYSAKAVVDYRIRKGRIATVEEIANLPYMHSARYLKLLPYLTTE